MEERRRPALTADIVVISRNSSRRKDGGLRCLLIRRGKDPFKGKWALPGGHVEPGETVRQAAVRELGEEATLHGLQLTELGCFSRPERDPRGWTVSIAYLGFILRAFAGEVRAGDDAVSAAWLDLSIEPGEILTSAVQYLRGQAGELAIGLLAQIDERG